MRKRAAHEAEQDVVKLAIAIARRVLHRELTVDPDAILGLVKAALQKIECAGDPPAARITGDAASHRAESLRDCDLPPALEIVDRCLAHVAERAV